MHMGSASRVPMKPMRPADGVPTPCINKCSYLERMLAGTLSPQWGGLKNMKRLALTMNMLSGAPNQ